MKRIFLITILLLVAGSQDLFADRNQYGMVHRSGVRAYTQPQSQDRQSRSTRPAPHHPHDLRSRFEPTGRHPVHPGYPGKPVHPIAPGYRPGNGRPGYWWWPAGTTVVRETQPIIIVNYPSPEAPAPPPKAEEVWVPPVMETRTEPGYWDYGVRKVWMGDHWRYEQDHEERIWVPASQVKVVKQEGYWKTVDEAQTQDQPSR